jgi:hypothetical protein
MTTKPAWRRFLALWIFMLLSYVGAKVGFNLMVFGWIDLRKAALLDALVLPSIQTLLLWLAFRLHRSVS